jgi:hypothetical protein
VTAKELQKRNAKAEKLRVIQVEDGFYYVESEEGKICYRVLYNDQGVECTCGNFARGIKSDSAFNCKHLLAVMNCVAKGDAEKAKVLERHKTKLDDRFIVNIEGKDFVLYAGLLDLAHQKGLVSIDVEPLQYPTKENGNMAVCRAIAQAKTGTFTDIGDADSKNCNSKVAKHLFRMASTRAKARALRDLTNIGLTALEELGDLNDVLVDELPQSKPKKRKPTAKKTRAKAKKTKEKPEATPKVVTEETPEEDQKGKSKDETKADSQQPESGQPEDATVPKMSEAQRRAVYNLSRRRGISIEELDEMAQEVYGTTVEYLSSQDASAFIRQLQQSA